MRYNQSSDIKVQKAQENYIIEQSLKKFYGWLKCVQKSVSHSKDKVKHSLLAD